MLECPMICATKTGDTPGWVNREASVWRKSHNQKYSRPASFRAFAQLLRRSLSGFDGSFMLGNTYLENSGPIRVRHRKSSILHQAEMGIRHRLESWILAHELGRVRSPHRSKATTVLLGVTAYTSPESRGNSVTIKSIMSP